MAWNVRWHVSCDQCGARCEVSHLDTIGAARKAEKRGWLLVNGFYGEFHFCPACKAKPDPELWPSRETLEMKNSESKIKEVLKLLEG